MFFKTEDNEQLVLGETYHYHDNKNLRSFILGLDVIAFADFSNLRYFPVSTIYDGKLGIEYKSIKVFKDREKCKESLKSCLEAEHKKALDKLRSL